MSMSPTRAVFGRAKPAADGRALGSGAAGRPALDRLSGAMPAFASAVSASVLAVGCLSLSSNGFDAYRILILGGLGLSLVLLALHVRYEDRAWSRELLALLAATGIAAIVLLRIPEYSYGHSVNGLVHRSLFTALILIALALSALCTSLYHVLGATPTARDRSRYPYLLLPMVMTAVAYGAILTRLVQKGASNLTWHAVTHAYSSQLTGSAIATHAGMRNHILGTLVLISMTGLIALPVGVGAGIFISEYDGWLARVVAFSTSMLRAISVFVLAVSAFSLVKYSGDHYSTGLVSDLVRGYYRDDAGFKHATKGSFITASAFLAMLVVPVIARATEEGLRSVPREIREGTTALGATHGDALLRILLPWTLPNVITGLLLGLAEAAGSVTVLLFISGSGQYGVGPRHEATSLAYLVFDAGRGSKSFTRVMAQYQFSAALLLVCITFTLTILALMMRQRFAARYRAGISYE